MLTGLHHNETELNVPLLLGRTQEQMALLGALANLIAGEGRVVLITGEAGIGKSALVKLVIAAAADLDALVLSGACYEYDLPSPYALWRDVLDGLPAAVDAQPHPLDIERAGGTDGLRRQVHGFLHGIVKQTPLVLVLEDLQWADESSLDLLRFIARQPDSAPILLIATCRDTEHEREQPLNRFLPDFIRETRPVRLALQLLDEDAIAQLVGLVAPGLPAPDCERLTAYLRKYGEGNPFFMEELLGLLRHEHVLKNDGKNWSLGELPEFPVPPLVRQVIDSRLVRLSPETLHLLEMASVVGIEVKLDVWRAISDADDDDLAAAVEEALGESVVEELPDASGYRFRHALIHGVMYERPNAVRRRQWHRSVAEWLAEQPVTDPAVVAHHFTQAADVRAADWLIDAGRLAARSFALRSASASFARAVDILDHDEQRLADKTWLLCALAEAHRYTDIDAALAWINRAHETLDYVDDPAMRVLTMWCRARIRGFNHENVIDDLRQAAAAYMGLSPEQRDRILRTSLRYVVSPATSSQEMASYGQFGLAREFGETFLRDSSLPASGNDWFEFGNAYLGLGIARAALGDADGARAAFEQATDNFLRVDNYQLASTSIYWALGTVAQVYDTEYPERRRHLREDEIATNRRSELARTAPISEYISTSETLILDGDWHDCRRSAEAREHVSASWIPSVRKLVHLDWLQGYPERAVERIQAVLPLGPDEPPGKRMFLHLNEIQWIAAELALDAHDLSNASRWIHAIERWAAWSGRVPGNYVPQLLWSRYHELEGDYALGQEYALAALELASVPRQPLGIMAAERALARLALHAGNPGRAAPHAAQALDLARACHAPYEIALALFTQARLMHASALHGDARQILDEARSIALRLEARPLLARIDLLAEDSAAPANLSDVPFGLSPRELEVLGYVARGYTDARIASALSISPRTVGGHLQSILNKTGTSSRTAATALAYERGLFSHER